MSKTKRYRDLTPNEITELHPDPGYNFADFLANLLKQGNHMSLHDCKKEWRILGDVEAEITRIGKERTRFVRDVLRKPMKHACLGIWGKGDNRHILLYDTDWAEMWADCYEVTREHHKHWSHRK